MKIFIIGAGLFGSVLAERITSQMNRDVYVIEKRPHIGGNCWSEVDPETGIECHCYGSHIFHTSNVEVWEYINQFAKFNNYRHIVLAKNKDKIYPMPINLQTINTCFKKNFNPTEAKEFMHRKTKKHKRADYGSLEEKAISSVGVELYNLLIKGYTKKQWGCDPKNLPASIINRLPIRYNYNNSYFDDIFQGVPIEGYYALFEKMLSSPKIKIKLNTKFKSIKKFISPEDIVIHSGAIDEYFGYCHGYLTWRTVFFKKEIHNVSDFQGTAVMNYTNENVPFTRIHEFNHYHLRKKQNKKTIIYKEFSDLSQSSQDPYYPINNEINQNKYHKYQLKLGKEYPNVIFGGRLGNYAYYDMDDTIQVALDVFHNKIKPRIEAYDHV
ncbi:UDP-galactopyranose mutase (plasmid) [Desulfobaculum bizertense]|uniref:UDP-galactopyranose mutase n=1 Tax=Desulfobaculum bizertense TaxID=376490 RepID=UPI001F443453|nr:UDP-galactopyranose mutase [Desulfobaculum bizertense]UIJ39521.1 UDP-galactopyranose mutase [Desulfobaculum bizertense]